jgi:hypothetical protein
VQAGDFLVSRLHLLNQASVLLPQLSLGLEQLVHLLFELLGSFLCAMELLLPNLLLLAVRALVSMHHRSLHHLASHFEFLPMAFSAEDLLNFRRALVLTLRESLVEFEPHLVHCGLKLLDLVVLLLRKQLQIVKLVLKLLVPGIVSSALA